MAIIRTSEKLSSHQEEYCICSKPFVFFRLIIDQHGPRLMTATAGEDVGKYRPFHDTDALIAATLRTFVERDLEYVSKKDQQGRPYVETSLPQGQEESDLRHLAATILDELGFEDVSVRSLRELRALHEEFSVGDVNEDAYLSDGTWVTPDGRLVEK